MKGHTSFEIKRENQVVFENKSQIDSQETATDGSFDLHNETCGVIALSDLYQIY